MRSTHRRTFVVSAVAAVVALLSGCFGPSGPTGQSSQAASGAGTTAVAPATTTGPSTDDGQSPSGTGPFEPAADAQWSFYLVRHAERADDGTDDPPLTPAGEQRAGRLADLLRNQPGAAVYATQFQRTQRTAQPTADAWRVPITTYQADRDPTDLITEIKAQHSGPVLVVGHSDTVPGIVAVLCGCEVGPIGETEFGNIYHVDIGSDGSVLTAEQARDY